MIDEQFKTKESPTVIKIPINRDGERAGDNDLVVAEKTLIEDEDSGKLSFKIGTYLNVLYDPFGSYREQLVKDNIKLKVVSKPVFNEYMMYLTSKNSSYYTRANRRFLNE